MVEVERSGDDPRIRLYPGSPLYTHDELLVRRADLSDRLEALDRKRRRFPFVVTGLAGLAGLVAAIEAGGSVISFILGFTISSVMLIPAVWLFDRPPERDRRALAQELTRVERALASLPPHRTG